MSTEPVAPTARVGALDEATWRTRARAHAERVDTFIRPHLERRDAQVKHPVHDFLFTYSVSYTHLTLPTIYSV